jgi:hypothetical protein
MYKRPPLTSEVVIKPADHTKEDEKEAISSASGTYVDSLDGAVAHRIRIHHAELVRLAVLWPQLPPESEAPTKS